MLYFTYNNKEHTDGAGAQIQRILSIYLLSKFSETLFGIKIGYVHSPIYKLDYQGLQCLEDNKEDSSLLPQYNQLIDLPSDTTEEFEHAFDIQFFVPQHLHRYRAFQENILIRITYAHLHIDTIPHVMSNKDIFSFPWIENTLHKPVQIAVHVRRGELLIVDSQRMLPNYYYVNCMEALASILQSAGIPYEFHLHTEVLTKPIDVTPSHHGIDNRIKQIVHLDPDRHNHLGDFQHISHVIYHINENPIETLKALTNSDILLASRSSFSYVAAILKKKGVTLFHPFWHALAPDWIPVSSHVDILNNSSKIICAISK